MLSRFRHKLLVPEVVQTSAMDCGPAALKALLEGHGVPVSYERLREACQTDVDGTSIDSLEELAVELGLDAEQVVLPVDSLLLKGLSALPALVVVRLPNGLVHFVVAWRRQGPWVQVMDPATGRRWPTRAAFLEECYVHAQRVPATAWMEWATGEEFQQGLRLRLRSLGIVEEHGRAWAREACSAGAWTVLAALDAAVRLTSSLVESKALRPGQEATTMVETLWGDGQERGVEALPSPFWFACPVGEAPSGGAGDEALLQGAVLVRARGLRGASGENYGVGESGGSGSGEAGPSSPELRAALTAPRSSPLRALFELLRTDGLLAPGILLGALGMASGAVLLEALLFRGLLDLGQLLGTALMRLAAIAAVLALLLALLLLEAPVVGGTLRIGRKLETRLRLRFLSKLRRLPDRYFASRLVSDMAERSHGIHRLRDLPVLGRRFLRAAFQLPLTAAGLIWLDPASAPWVCVSVVAVLTLPLLFHPVLREQDFTVRSYAGALSRFYLDGLAGLLPIRSHGAERALMREHEGVLVQSGRASIASGR